MRIHEKQRLSASTVLFRQLPAAWRVGGKWAVTAALAASGVDCSAPGRLVHASVADTANAAIEIAARSISFHPMVEIEASGSGYSVFPVERNADGDYVSSSSERWSIEVSKAAGGPFDYLERVSGHVPLYGPATVGERMATAVAAAFSEYPAKPSRLPIVIQADAGSTSCTIFVTGTRHIVGDSITFVVSADHKNITALPGD